VGECSVDVGDAEPPAQYPRRAKTIGIVFRSSLMSHHNDQLFT
jgi:hypothetical protein